MRGCDEVRLAVGRAGAADSAPHRLDAEAPEKEEERDRNEGGETDQKDADLDAAGAALLFTTNLAAIIVVASIVFLLAGARPVADGVDRAGRMRSGLVVAVIALAVIAVPLVWRSYQNVTSTMTALSGAPVVRGWIGERDLEVTEYTIQGETIEMTVAGSEVPRDVPALAQELARTLGHAVDVTVVYVPRVRVKAEAN